jgi:hypothetical protein
MQNRMTFIEPCGGRSVTDPDAPSQIRTGVLASCPPSGMKGLTNKNAMCSHMTFLDAPSQIRTGVLALKGLRPGPLDDGGNNGRILPPLWVRVKHRWSFSYFASGKTSSWLSCFGLLTIGETGNASISSVG